MRTRFVDRIMLVLVVLINDYLANFSQMSANNKGCSIMIAPVRHRRATGEKLDAASGEFRRLNHGKWRYYGEHGNWITVACFSAN